MDVYMNEREQLQLIRAWLKKYGPSIVIGIVLAFVGSYGWRYWLQHRYQQSEQASLLYEQMLTSQTNNQTQQMNQVANNLMMQYNNTPYAALAGLTLASTAVAQGDLPTAEKNLQWVITHASDEQLVQIAKIREARVLLAENKPQDALKLLATVTDENFMPAIAIVKGDIFVALADKTSAKNAYQQALTTLPANAAIRPMVQMKFDALS